MRVTAIRRSDGLLKRVRGWFSNQSTTETIEVPTFRKPKLEMFDPSRPKSVIDPWDTLYGWDRLDVALRMKGIANPKRGQRIKRKDVSTKDDPNVLTSFKHEQIMGCICEEDNCHVKYMQIFQGETKRCFCGHWFRLDEAHFPDLSEFGIDSKAAEEYFKEN